MSIALVVRTGVRLRRCADLFKLNISESNMTETASSFDSVTAVASVGNEANTEHSYIDDD